MRRLFVVLALAGLCLMGLLWSGQGRHVVSPGATTTPAPASDSYPYLSADAPYPVAYVGPVVQSFLADVPAGASVLDLGSGNGALLGAFKERGWRRVGVDISTSGVAFARQAHPDITFVEADATSDLTPLIGAGTFDVVISTETLEHVTLPRLFLRSAFVALKPGGRLVLSVPYNGYLKNLAIALLGRTDHYFDPMWDWGHIKFYSVDTLTNLLQEAGFTTLEYEGAGRVPYFWKSVVFSARKPESSAR
jgi:SAM-dependent methyltransferase